MEKVAKTVADGFFDKERLRCTEPIPSIDIEYIRGNFDPDFTLLGSGGHGTVWEAMYTGVKDQEDERRTGFSKDQTSLIKKKIAVKITKTTRNDEVIALCLLMKLQIKQRTANFAFFIDAFRTTAYLQQSLNDSRIFNLMQTDKQYNLWIWMEHVDYTFLNYPRQIPMSVAFERVWFTYIVSKYLDAFLEDDKFRNYGIIANPGFKRVYHIGRSKYVFGENEPMFKRIDVDLCNVKDKKYVEKRPSEETYVYFDFSSDRHVENVVPFYEALNELRGNNIDDDKLNTLFQKHLSDHEKDTSARDEKSTFHYYA